MKKLLIYIHGRYGDPNEADGICRYLKDTCVAGMDYKSEKPWEAREEFPALFDELGSGYESVSILANSIGAYFAMLALGGKEIDKILLAAPVVDMEGLIRGMMAAGGVTESELRKKGEIGELSWKYLEFAIGNPPVPCAETYIMYPERDALTSRNVIEMFASKHGAELTVLPGCEHWIHREDDLRTLYEWAASKIEK